MHNTNKIEVDLNIEKNIFFGAFIYDENIFSIDVLKEFENHELDISTEHANDNNMQLKKDKYEHK